MKSYGQYCSVARGLDHIGNRWSMLIVRELLLQGPCRYTDLHNGLPGIATNLLVERLAELERSGIVERMSAPPPVATTLYRLTEKGAGLEAVLEAVATWGITFMEEPMGDDEFRPHWFGFPVARFLRDRAPQGPPAVIALVTPFGDAWLQIGGGAVTCHEGRVESADLRLSGSPRVILGVLSGHLRLGELSNLDLHVEGDAELLERVILPRGQTDGASKEASR